MGCGISTMDAEDASLGRRRFNRPRHQHAIVPPIADNNNMELDQGNNNNNSNNNRNEEAKTNKEELGFNRKEEEVRRVFIESREKDQKDKKEEHYYVSDDHKNAKNVKNVEEHKEENDDEEMDDHFIGPGSPSFSYYCNDYDSVDRSSVTDSINDYCDSDQSTKSGSDDGSTNRTRNEKNVNFNKEHGKKERRGRGFRNVMNKGKNRGRRNLLNFACYNASNQSYAEGSLNKIANKTT